LGAESEARVAQYDGVSSVLVTGLGGFLGSRCLAELIRLGYEVHGVTRGEPLLASRHVHWHRADLLNEDDVSGLVQRVRAPRLLHLAWISDHPVFWTSQMNAQWLRASLQLVNSFVESGGERVVVSGSCAEYKIPSAGPCIEDRTPIEPETPYGKAKAALHSALREYAGQTGISFGWGRIFFAYGPGEPPTKLISSLIRARQSGVKFDIRDPGRRVDYISVRDAGRALATLVHSPLNGAVNIGSGTPTTAAGIANLVARLLPRVEQPAPIAELDPRRDGPYADATRLHEELGFSCRVTLEDGIAEMIAENAPARPSPD
jgi:nucleoside-diphosphate-sugar epimerase